MKEKFDWNKFLDIDNKIAVHCATEEEAKMFCNLMDKHNLTWLNGVSYTKMTDWEIHKEETCYDSEGCYAEIESYKEDGYEVLEFNDYDFDDNYEKDKVKTKFNWEEFLNKKNRIAVHCRTASEADMFCRLMHERDLKWSSGESYFNNTEWHNYRSQTCYTNQRTYGTFDFITNYYEILEFSEYDFSEEPKKEKEKFDWDYFMNSEDVLAVHCDTKEKAQKFCKLMNKYNLLQSETLDKYLIYNLWETHNHNTCYDNQGGYGDITDYKRYRYTIWEFDSFEFGESEEVESKEPEPKTNTEEKSTPIINAVKYFDEIKKLTEGGKKVKVNMKNEVCECDSECCDCLFELDVNCKEGLANWLMLTEEESSQIKIIPEISESTKEFLRHCYVGCNIVRIKDDVIIIDGENLGSSTNFTKIKSNIFPQVYCDLVERMKEDEVIKVCDLVIEED